MKSYERLERYLNGEEVDSFPFEVFSSTQALAHFMGYDHNDLQDEKVYDEVIREAFNKFDTDLVRIGYGQSTIGKFLGSKVRVNEHGNEMVQEFVLEDYKDLEKLYQKKNDVKREFEKIIEFGRNIKKRNDFIHIGSGMNAPFTTASGIRSAENILRDTRKNKEKLKELLELSLELNIEWVKAFTSEFGKTRFHIADPVSSLNLISIKQYEEFSKPYFSRLVDKIREITGIKPQIHICGKSKKMWPFFKRNEYKHF